MIACGTQQRYVENTQYLSRNISKRKSNELASKILKACVNHKQGVHPRIFCRRWFGLEDVNEYGQPRYTEEQILAMEYEHGYREKCINLIARVLKIKPNTIHRWGKGVEFDNISPDKRVQYEIYLGYVDTIRVMAMNLAEVDEAVLVQLLHC